MGAATDRSSTVGELKPDQECGITSADINLENDTINAAVRPNSGTILIAITGNQTAKILVWPGKPKHWITAINKREFKIVPQQDFSSHAQRRAEASLNPPPIMRDLWFPEVGK